MSRTLLLDRFAAVLADLAMRHGLSNPRHGGPGTVVADVEPGRTLSDLARFELEAESLLDHEVFVASADAPAALQLAGPFRLGEYSRHTAITSVVAKHIDTHAASKASQAAG